MLARARHCLQIALCSALLLAPGVASAEAPFDLPDELNDLAGVVTSVEQLGGVQDRLVAERGLQLFVVTVDDFDGQDPDRWLERTAELSGLGREDLALAVSIDTGELALRVPEGTGLSARAVTSTESAARQLLADGDIDAAVLRVATGLEGASWSNPATALERRATWVTVTIGVLILLGFLAAGWLVRAKVRAAQERARQEAQRLASALGPTTVALDRALADGTLEVALAEAEFDPPLIASLNDELAAARDESLAAHRLRAEVASGPSDGLNWLVPPKKAVTLLQQAQELSGKAQGRLSQLVQRLRNLRHQADLQPGRLEKLRAQVAQQSLPPHVQTQVEALLARAAADVAADRPEAAMVPLDTIVEHLRGLPQD